MYLLDNLMLETCLSVCAFHLQDQNFEHLILESRGGSINDAELKAHLEQFGEVIEVRIYACVCVCVCVCIAMWIQYWLLHLTIKFKCLRNRL